MTEFLTSGLLNLTTLGSYALSMHALRNTSIALRAWAAVVTLSLFAFTSFQLTTVVFQAFMRSHS